MASQIEFYRLRMDEHNLVFKSLEDEMNIPKNNITGKKRKYKEAMGYQNDYEVVQEPKSYITNKIKIRGKNWIDSYLENIQP